MRFAIIAFLLVAVVASILSDWLIYRDLCFLKKKKKLRIAHLVFATLLYCLLLAAFISLLTPVNSMLFTGWCIFIYLSVFVAKFLYIIFRGISAIPVLFKHKAWKSVQIAGFAVSVACFILLWWNAIITPRQFDINEVTIESAKLPAAFNGYRIVQFSDLHVGTFGNSRSIPMRLVEKINALKPDLIVFTGDIVNNRSSELIPFIPSLRNLEAKDGIVSILGNHDYGDYAKWKTESAKRDNLDWLVRIEEDSLNWRLLRNEHFFLKNGNDSIAIIGVENWGEPPFSTHGDLNKAYPDINDKHFKLLLSHNPKHWDIEVCHTPVDLTLSGHTHAMQAGIQIGNWEWSPSKYFYPEYDGLYREGKQYLHVSRGQGFIGYPGRVGLRPVITQITLKQETE